MKIMNFMSKMFDSFENFFSSNLIFLFNKTFIERDGGGGEGKALYFKTLKIRPTILTRSDRTRIGQRSPRIPIST